MRKFTVEQFVDLLDIFADLDMNEGEKISIDNSNSWSWIGIDEPQLTFQDIITYTISFRGSYVTVEKVYCCTT